MLRPVFFKILSTTQLKISFNSELNSSIKEDNFIIYNVSDGSSTLDIVSISIEEKSVTINTRPQVSKAYYVLSLIDSPSSLFIDTNGVSLVNDDISRNIYFIGIDKVNQIRDDVFFKVPPLYNLDGSLINSILSLHSDELLNAQHSIGSLLNDNYIKQSVTNEIRTRGKGSTDRLSNENAFKINRVSLYPENSSIYSKTIEITSTDIYPICLRQELVESYTIDNLSEDSSFNGFLISLPNNNIIKVTSAILIKEDDSEDCSGNIGTEYDIQKYKYSIKSNKYDQYNSFQNSSLKSNQILFSDFSNWDKPQKKDKILLSYYYDNNSIRINKDTINVYEVASVVNESVPSNSTIFTLAHDSIIDSNDEQPTLDGLTFKKSENISDVPAQFSTEIPFESSGLPKYIGEFSVNYSTGDVYVVGSKIGEGTGYNNFYVDYTYKNKYKLNLDYSINESEISLNSLRDIFGKNIKIYFEYESVFSEGIDYNSLCHKEILGEDVQNRITSSFSLKTKNSPITDVFRIYNKTNGEVYSLNYFNGNDVYFTGKTLPSGIEKNGESALFNKVDSAYINATGTLISPMYYGTITLNSTYNSIEITPGIPYEFLDQQNTEYYIRFLDEDLDDYLITDFYTKDSNGLINGLSISPTVTIPSINTSIQIGCKVYIIDLPDNRILNKYNDGIGNVISSSVSFSSEIFKYEKYFKVISDNSNVTLLNSGTQTYSVTNDQHSIINDNLSRLRSYGDYCIDYTNGVIYLAVLDSTDHDLGTITYSSSSVLTRNQNVLSVTNIYKNISIDDNNLNYKFNNFEIIDNSTIKINDMNSSLYNYDGTSIIDSDGTEKELLIVNEDYSSYIPYNGISIRYIGLLKDLVGLNLDSTIESERYLESNSSNLNKSIVDGGKNIYSDGLVYIKDNIIDFKKSADSKFYISNSNYKISFKTKYFSKIYSMNDQNDEIILNSDLNYIIQDNIAVSSIEEDTELYLKINFNEDITNGYSLSPDYDYIFANSERWKIIAYNSGYFIINKLSDVNEIEFDKDLFSLGIRPSIVYNNDLVTITFPINYFIGNKTKYTLKYVTLYSPEPGTAISVEYNSGPVYIDYIYTNDNIIVYYEYGDNEIDWSINNSILEGQLYYVSYEYGALRTALRKNFGNLTSIPFFENNSYNIDRELYRDALSGVLSSFPKGSTIPAIENIVQSISKTKPDINELTFGSWILGRDYLSPEKISYTGDLNFVNGKFGTALNIKDDLVLTLPALSNLSIGEGTIEAWVSPNFDGVSNDATITFDFKNIGTSKYYYLGGNPFDFKNNYGVVGSSDLNDAKRGFDFTSGALRIFKVEGSNDGYSLNDLESYFGIYKKDISINRNNKSNGSIILNVNYSNILRTSSSYNDLVSNGVLNSFIFNLDDNYKSFILKGVLNTYKEESHTVVFTTGITSFDELPNFDPPYKTRGCSCTKVDTSVLKNFNDLEIEITLNSLLLKSDLFSDLNLLNNDIGCLNLVTNDGFQYSISAFANEDGIKSSSFIPNNISKIYLKRFPLNYEELRTKSYDEINDISIRSFILVRKNIFISLKEDQKSELFFNTKFSWCLDWDNKFTLDYFIDPINNKSKIGINKNYFNFFYTDLINSSDLFEYKNTIIIGVTNLTSVNLYKNTLEITNILSTNDIYIGSSGTHPFRNKFELNRFNSDFDVNGISLLSENTNGIFIGYDQKCENPYDDSGQWVLKARILKYTELPYDVNIVDDNFENLKEFVYIDDRIDGSIISSGDFSSITKGRIDSNYNCLDKEPCYKHYKFFGNKRVLDYDGWVQISDSDSDSINSINGGREVEESIWKTFGTMNIEKTVGSSNVIYGVSSLSDYQSYLSNSAGIICENACSSGNIEFTINAKISNVDNNIYSTSIDKTIISSGITFPEITTDNYSICLSFDKDLGGNKLISIVDLSSLNKILSIPFDWYDLNYHRYTISINVDSGYLTLFVDFSQLGQILLSSLSQKSDDSCNVKTINNYSINLIDSRFVSFDINTMSSPVLNIDFMEAISNYNPGTLKLEDEDIIIASNKQIDFILHSNPSSDDSFNIDGYTYESDVDQIMFSSDDEKYILDSYNESGSRFSLFKDGKGFLNFRIIDDKKDIYNLSYNIKDFKSGEWHHVACSWRLNSSYKKDEMHLFIDGFEVPNLFKFGGFVKTKVNSKFSDVAKYQIYDYLNRNISFPTSFFNGETFEGTNKLSSTITNDFIGRTLIFEDGSSLVGKIFTIISVNNDGTISLGDHLTLEPHIFSSSESNIKYSLVPYVLISDLDLTNDDCSIFRTTCLNEVYELGCLFYTVSNEEITIKNSVKTYGARCNLSSGIIEFVQQNSSTCYYESSVSKDDIDVHIKTFGLTASRFKNILSISGTSLFLDEGFDKSEYPNSRDGYSIFMTNGPKPRDLNSVSIKKYILYNKELSIGDITYIDDIPQTIAEISLSEDDKSLVSTFSQNDSKINQGRLIDIIIDSDNIIFEKDNVMTITGLTSSGPTTEDIYIYKNGVNLSSECWISIDSIQFKPYIVDIDDDSLCLINIIERNSIFESDQGGTYANIYKYSDGNFLLSKDDLDEYEPYELNKGYYLIDYSAALSINLKDIGNKIIIGNSYDNSGCFNGLIDEFAILNNMINDVRSWELSTSGVRSITEDYFRNNPLCITDSTLVLIDFESPYLKQSRRLRNTKLFDSENNFSYNFNQDQIEKLINLINDKYEFISYLKYLGYSNSTSETIFYEVSKADDGPLYNLSKYRPLIGNLKIVDKSVNSSYGQSSLFEDKKYISIDNSNNILRNKGGTIEFWYNPILDSFNDSKERTFFESSSVIVDRTTSFGSNIIKLNKSISNVLSIRLLSSKKLSDTEFYSSSEKNSILFDEISLIEATGKYSSGTGTLKDFSKGCSLSADGKTIFLKDNLPSVNTDVVITYVPKQYSGEKISIYKDDHSRLIFNIQNSKYSYRIPVEINWSDDSWHRIAFVYNLSSTKYMKAFVDGVEYKDVYKYLTDEKVDIYSSDDIISKLDLSLNEQFSKIYIGNKYDLSSSANGYIDNIRISIVPREFSLTSTGEYIDSNYSSNLTNLKPVVKDDLTSYLNDFDYSYDDNFKTATVIDQKNGIFDFEVIIRDDFSKILGINNGNIEDLIIELINRIKPAHSNAYVKFIDKKCIE